MSVDAERSILGAILLGDEIFPQAAGSLHKTDFCLDSHRRIYARMLDLHESGQPIEILSLTEELKRHKELEAVGGVASIHALTEGMPRRDSIEYCVKLVRREAGIRHIQRGIEALGQHAAEPGATINELRARLAALDLEAGDYENESAAHITSLEQIPDPFSISSEVRWIVPDLIPAQGITVIAGEAGAGKTWIALTLARAARLGGDFFGRGVVPGPGVLYLDRENPLALVRSRLKILFGGPGVIIPWGSWCPDEPPLIGDARLLEFARKGLLIIFDSLIRFHAFDENSATEMSKVMSYLRALTTAGATVVVLHHRAKTEGSKYRGSSDILAGCDVAFALTRREDLLELTTVKNRFAAETTITVRPDFAAGSFQVVAASPVEHRRDEIETLAEIIRSSPGLTQNSILEKAGFQRVRAIELLANNVGRLWRRESGPNRSQRYFPIPVVPAIVLNGSVGNHCSGGSAVDSDWPELQGITKVVPVSPPLRGGNREPHGSSHQ